MKLITPMNNNIEEAIKTHESKYHSRSSAFKPPTVEDIKTYAKEQGYDIDAQYVWDFYESKDWKVGKTKMKVWRAAIRRAFEWKKPGGKPVAVRIIKIRHLCCCGCGREGVRQISGRWYATTECRIKVLGW